MDSDEDGDNEQVISLTHLLFGNIGEDGQLENDFLDPESIRHLHQLRQLGIGTQLKELTEDVESPCSFDQKDYSVNDEYNVKSPSAVDYSDITELADEMEENGDATVSSTEEKGSCCANSEDTTGPKPSDTDLMPPPPLPPPKEEMSNPESSDLSNPTNTDSVIREKRCDVEAPKIDTVEQKLDTPLAAMLPSKYKNMDVTKIFPEFRHGQVLRFSRLFGPGKPTSLPQLWRGVKKKKKKKKNNDELGACKGTKKNNLEISTSLPQPEECETDDESKLMKPEEKNKSGTNNETCKTNELFPGLAAWRFGPAQLWYDMLNVSESGEGFDYGFKLKDPDVMEDTETENATNLDNEYPDDAYFMVTQYQWEDDVIWNGEEVKHKVLAKLNNRNNAAGWVPSSHNRTASAFSEQAKTFSATLQTGIPKPSNQQGSKINKNSTANRTSGIATYEDDEERGEEDKESGLYEGRFNNF